MSSRSALPTSPSPWCRSWCVGLVVEIVAEGNPFVVEEKPGETKKGGKFFHRSVGYVCQQQQRTGGAAEELLAKCASTRLHTVCLLFYGSTLADVHDSPCVFPHSAALSSCVLPQGNKLTKGDFVVFVGWVTQQVSGAHGTFQPLGLIVEVRSFLGSLACLTCVCLFWCPWDGSPSRSAGPMAPSSPWARLLRCAQALALTCAFAPCRSSLHVLSRNDYAGVLAEHASASSCLNTNVAFLILPIETIPTIQLYFEARWHVAAVVPETLALCRK